MVAYPRVRVRMSRLFCWKAAIAGPRIGGGISTPGVLHDTWATAWKSKAANAFRRKDHKRGVSHCVDSSFNFNRSRVHGENAKVITVCNALHHGSAIAQCIPHWRIEHIAGTQ